MGTTPWRRRAVAYLAAGRGTLDDARIPTILKRFTADRAFWTVAEISREVLGAAETLSTAHPLQVLDAIQVASAQIFASRLGRSNVLFVSGDERQTSGAAAIGLATRFIGS